MVDKNISAECLKPELWTHLQEILDLYCPPVKILHILQKAEGFRAVTQNGEKVMLDSKSLEQPKGLLEALHICKFSSSSEIYRRFLGLF